MTVLQDILASFKKAQPVGTNGKGDAAPAELLHSDEARTAWQRLIDEKLIEWGRHPEQFEDEDGYKAPSADNLVRATEFITFCRDHGVGPALRMAPDGDGGVVFEWYEGAFCRYVEIHADGSMEYLVFEDARLLVRQSIA
jgi:hypothetical protein